MSDFLSWDHDIDLDILLGEYTEYDTDNSNSDVSGDDTCTKPKKPKTSSGPGDQTYYTCPECKKQLKTVAGFRGHDIIGELFVQQIKVVKHASDTQQSNLSTNDQSILYYIAGFIIKALKKRYSCVSTNKSSIVSKLLNSTNNTTFVNTYGKWFTKQDRGGLQKPCDTFFFLVRELEMIVRKSISPPYSASSLSLQPLKESFMESFMVKYYTDIMFKGETCDTMSSITEDIIHLFLTVRGYAFTRIERNKISNSSKASSGLRRALREKVSN
ncbi:unnamed protein product [Mytilus coruscus]|uniref:Uncharacterized protein n=1 Tax=Mytilus coruscus TaxID=42192 RepID=A0A6J8A6P3_MYTCO|nr:unnamed protein product [Mytilus coruscus]